MILDDIYKVIIERKGSPLEGSYVSALQSKGKDEILRKIGEESIEVILAAKSADRRHLIGELADLWFHCLVLMAGEGISHSDIFEELEKRSGKRRR